MTSARGLNSNDQSASSGFDPTVPIGGYLSESRRRPMMVAEIEDEINDEDRFQALFEGQMQKDRSGKFSLTRYSEYTRR